MAISDLSTQIDAIAGIRNSDPNLEKAYQEFLVNGESDTYTQLVLSSDFYKNNNQLARQRKQAAVNQPGAAKQDLVNYQLATKKRLVAAGVKITPDVDKQIELSYYTGMADNQLDSILVSSAKIGQIGGSTGSDVLALQQYANSFGVGKLLNGSYWNQKGTDLFAGTTTADDIQAEIRNLSAGAYPSFAKGILAGKTLDSQTSYMTYTVAKTLNLDPASLTPDDPRIKKFYNYKDSTGQVVEPPQWYVEQETRKLPEWDKTPEARGLGDTLAMRVISDMGLG